MAEDVLLLYFPDEVLEHILENENLSCKDIYNFGSTCSKFRKVIDSNKLWKTKFHQRWPSIILSGIYKGQESIDWKDQYATRVRLGIAVTNLLNEMSPAFYKKDELCNADFSMFVDLILSHSMALRFMIDELMTLVNGKDKYNNLTNKYYGGKVLTYLRHIEVARKWKIFKTEPPEKQILERGAVLVAQWCQPDLEVTDESISKQLDFIANWVRSVIKEEYGERHPALCIPPEVLEEWRTTNIDDNKYNPTVSRQVIKAVSEVLFKHMGYHGDSEMYYLPENSYINRVLENRQGIPITLSIVFESVTRRLGIKCEPVSFPGHFLLRWRDRYEKQKEVDGVTAPNVSSCSIVKSGDHYTSGSELMLLLRSHHSEGFTGQAQYIDVFNGGKFLTKESCPNFSAQSRCPMSELFRHGPASAIQVVERMANNLEVAGRQRNQINGRLARLRTVLELLQLINPLNLSSLLQLARLYMLCNLHMDIVTLLDTINNMEVADPRDQGQAAHIKRMLELYLTQEEKRKEYEEVKESTVRLREGRINDVAYSVGMVMHHVHYDYTCVIYGWDSKCAADADWKAQMNVNALTRRDNQPFYNVLVNDGSTRYAAEDNLEVSLDKNAWIDHHEIGRYFHTFCGTHYLPNNEKEKEYPHDAEMRNFYYSHLK